MTSILDTNILIKLYNENEPLHEECVQLFERLKAGGPVLINDIIYCELCIGFERNGDAADFVHALGIEVIRQNKESLFNAGRAYQKYKNENQGPKLGVLPDFLIGAFAASIGGPLVTINPKDFVGYFPEIEILTPNPQTP